MGEHIFYKIFKKGFNIIFQTLLLKNDAFWKSMKGKFRIEIYEWMTKPLTKRDKPEETNF